MDFVLFSNSISKVDLRYDLYIAIYKDTLKLVEHKYLEILKVWSYTEKTLTRNCFYNYIDLFGQFICEFIFLLCILKMIYESTKG